jgi:hypothetical protein
MSILLFVKLFIVLSYEQIATGFLRHFLTKGNEKVNKKMLTNDQIYGGHDPIFNKNGLGDEEIIKFLRDGHIILKGLVNPEMIVDNLTPSLAELYYNNRYSLRYDVPIWQNLYTLSSRKVGTNATNNSRRNY